MLASVNCPNGHFGSTNETPTLAAAMSSGRNSSFVRLSTNDCSLCAFEMFEATSRIERKNIQVVTADAADCRAVERLSRYPPLSHLLRGEGPVPCFSSLLASSLERTTPDAPQANFCRGRLQPHPFQGRRQT